MLEYCAKRFEQDGARIAELEACIAELEDAKKEDEICWSMGPRIGSEGVPYCKMERGHLGKHRPPPEDGWGNIEWGKPDNRRPPTL